MPKLDAKKAELAAKDQKNDTSHQQDFT